MASVQSIQPNQMIVTFDDVNLMPQVKKAIALMRGVKGVAMPRAKKLSAIDQSLKEVREGKLYEAKDLDDLFSQLND